MMKSKLLFVSMIVTICSFIGELSMVGLVMFAVGFSMVVTMLEFPLMYGGRYMKKITRRICLAFGMITTMVALLGEVDMVAFVVFAVGFAITIFTLNNMVEDKSAESTENNI